MLFLLRSLSLQLNVLLFLIPGAYTLCQQKWITGSVFLFVALFLETTAIEQLQGMPWVRFWNSHSNTIKVGLIWAMWVGLCIATLSIESFGWAVSKPELRPEYLHTARLWLMFVFMFGLIGAARLGNVEGKSVKDKDISSTTSRIWFWAIFLLAVFMRAYKMSSPEGSYGFDEAAGVMETRLVRDMQNFRQGYYIAYYQKPIFCYLTLFLWHWLPNATDLFIVRLAAMVSDLGSVWLLYLTGKELGGRKTGILAMAIGAISKPELILSAMGMGAVMVPFFILLPLLFALRVFKKPNLSHFLQLGLGLSLGIYDNDYIRVELLFFIAIIFFWLLLKKDNRIPSGPMGWIVLINFAVLSFYCFYMAFGFIQAGWINHLFHDRNTECFVALFACFFLLAVSAFALGSQSQGVKKNKYWIDAFLGLWICVLIDYPMMTRADSWERLDSMVDRSQGLGVAIMNFVDRIEAAIQLLFCWGTSPANMGNLGDSFFSYGEVTAIFLGFAFLVVKPSWSKAFVFVVAAVGILPFVVAGGTHNVRVADTVGPFILIGALGLNELLKKMWDLSKKKWPYYAALSLLVLFGAWCAWTTYSRVYYLWFDKQVLYFTGARNITAQETALGNRIYFCDDIFSVEAVVVNEGFLVHHVYPTNVIYRKPGDKPQDISLLAHDFSSVQGKDLQMEVKKYFPQVVWERSGEIEYCRIPAALLNNKQKMFIFEDEKPDSWKREFIRNEDGLIFDLIAYVDRVPHIDDPIGPDYSKTYDETVHQWLEAVRYSTTIHVAHEGDFVVHYKAKNRSYLKIDGKMVADLSFFQLLDSDLNQIYWAPEKEGDKKIHLTSGDHEVEVVTAFQRTFDPPGFWIRSEGTAAPGTSLWSSFDF